MKARDGGLKGVQDAITLVGSVKALATALGCSRSAVATWKSYGGIPLSKVSVVSQVTGLPPDPLRPDVFGKPVTSPTGPAEAQAPFSLEARSLGLNPAAIAATALKKAIGDKKARRWAEGNFEAIEAHNRYVEQHGLPLDKYRMF